MVSEIFEEKDWDKVQDFNFEDITYHKAKKQGTVRIAFNRPGTRNSFRPQTVDELYLAFDHARCSPDIGVVLLTGNGPSPKDGGWAFCSGGDQKVRGKDGYEYKKASTEKDIEYKSEKFEKAKLGRLHILEVQRMIRFMPKVVICLVPGWAVGGGHSLHVICDMTLASEEHAKFKQTDAEVSSFDGGYGSAYLAKMVGQKRAREIFFMDKTYSAREAYEMGMVNAVVPHKDLEKEGLKWGEVITRKKGPTAIRMLKYAFNMVDDGLVGQQLFAGEATRLAYASDEAKTGVQSFLNKEEPDFRDYPWHF